MLRDASSPRLRPLAGLALPLRFALALAFSFLVSLTIKAVSYAPLFGSDYFVVVVAIAAGAVVVPVLLNGVPSRITGPFMPVVTLGAALFVALVLSAIPGEARADNCSGLADCFNAILAAAAAPMLLAGALSGSQPPDDGPPVWPAIGRHRRGQRSVLLAHGVRLGGSLGERTSARS